ncbi:hypothetical protein KAT21_01830 [Candidatus Bathyarchaeota archaeon]|nr:hypothetical protein [Candidatus Bathyarchaeota archaeon]
MKVVTVKVSEDFSRVLLSLGACGILKVARVGSWLGWIFWMNRNRP